jgi:MarR family transcriptional regulator for hemolysin
MVAGASPSLPIGFLIDDIARLQRTVLNKILRPYGVTRSQWRVLNILARCHEGGQRQGLLADAMDLGKVSLSGLIDRLERKQFVQRKATPHDRRAKRIIMTESGSKLMARVERITNAVYEEIMGGAPAPHVLQAHSLLESMKRQLITVERDSRRRKRVRPTSLGDYQTGGRMEVAADVD